MLTLTAAAALAAHPGAISQTALYLLWATYLVCMALMGWPLLRRSLHIFQLSSYQRLSYLRFFAENPEWFQARRLVPLLLLALSPALLFFAPVPIVAIVALAVALWFVSLNRKQGEKKPLVYTARAKRLILTQVIVSLVAFFALNIPSSLALFPAYGYGPSAAIVIFCQPWLLLLSGRVNGPAERRIAQHYVRHAHSLLEDSPRLKVIGITGSYGKTSVKYFLGELLSSQYHVFMTPGNFNTTLGVTRAVREGLLPTHEVFLCEMGARHPGDIKEICDLVRPTLGVLTAVAEQHLETFGSLETIRKTKLELYDAVRANGGQTFVNLDSAPLADAGLEGGVISYGLAEGRDYRASEITVSEEGSAFTVTAPDGETAHFRTRLLGRANVQNILAALAVCHHMGISFDALAPRVLGLKGVPHRLELSRGPEYTLIDDAYNSNPDGARIALETLGMFGGTRIVITPGLVELGGREAEHNQALGAEAARHCEYALLVGKRRAGPIRKGLLSAGFPEDRISVFDRVEDAIAAVSGIPGGVKTVLLLNDLPDNY